MTDQEWEQQRNRAIAEAFRTGRSVLANSDGEMQYADGDRESVSPLDAGMPYDVEAMVMQARRSYFWLGWVCGALACGAIHIIRTVLS